MTNKKYVMYLRKSRYDADYDVASVEETIKRHKTVLTAHAEKYGLNVVEVFQEVVSGESIRQRPEMMKMLDYISSEDIEGILCMDIDRLARGNSIDQGIISQTLQYTGTKIITPYKTYDPGNEFDEEYMEFGLFMSRKEYKIINRRLERGRKQSAAEGRYMGGSAPYGYEMVKLKGEKGNTLKMVPEQAEVVKKIFDLYCNHGYGYVRITNFLNDLQLPSPKGGKWGTQTIRQMLHNAVYAGYIRSGFKPVIKKLEDGEIVKHRKYNLDCALYPGKHEAIVDKAMLDKAMALGGINSYNKTNKRGTFHYIFAGLLYCSECGVKMKSTQDSREKRIEHRYRIRCETHGCTQASTKQRDVEKTVLATLKEWLIFYQIKQPEKYQEDELDGVSVLSKTENEIRALKLQRERICELLETGVYDIETFKARDNVLQEKLSELIAKKEKFEKEINRKKISKEEAIPKIQQLLDSWERITPEEKNKMLKQVISRIDYYRPNKDEDLKLDVYPNF